MSILPTGLPAWLRTNDFTHYGGNKDKENYLSRGAIDALTDVDAKQFARLTADVAALSRVAPFCVITLLCSDTAPGSPTFESFIRQTGSTAVGYLGSAPPSGFPTVTRNGIGDVSIAFSSSYLDSYGISGDFSISSMYPALLSATPGVPTVERVSDTEARLRAFTLAGSALANARMSLTIWGLNVWFICTVTYPLNLI